MRRMCHLLVIPHVLCSLFPHSPYFYDSELDKICENIITESIIELYNPTYFLEIDADYDERRNQVVFK